MPLSVEFEFDYGAEPSIIVLVSFAGTARQALVRALLDTGSTATIFDSSFARYLGIDFGSTPPVEFQGVGGRLRGARRAEVRLLLLVRPELSLPIEVAFADGIESTVGNLIGLDVLSYFDFGLSHAHRTGYLGRPNP
jgi:hypothetical protein